MRVYNFLCILIFLTTIPIKAKYRHQKQVLPSSIMPDQVQSNQEKNIKQQEIDDEKPTFTIKKIEHETHTSQETIEVKQNNSHKMRENQETKSSSLLDILCSPILFSDAGFRCYIKHRYNRTQYNDFLPLCFTDMLEFLTYGKRQSSRDYPKRIINLFHKKLKESSYVNAFAFNELLVKMPETLKHYFSSPEKTGLDLQQNINKILYSSFLKKFDNFKAEPDIFLENLSSSLATMALESITLKDGSTTQEELRSMIMRFLEHGLSKLVWSPEEDGEVWQSVKSLARNLAEFGKAEIFLYEEDLDDLYWSLITRFGYFIELAGSQISLETYQKMQKELEYDELYFLDIEEQEDYIQTKKEYLLNIFKAGSAKAHAASMGFVSEIISA